MQLEQGRVEQDPKGIRSETIKEIQIMNELLELNQEIEDLEDDYVIAKLEYETKKADLLINTDFGIALGKAKPTVGEKDAYVTLQCADEKQAYKMIGNVIGSKKRELEIRLRFVGDE